MLTFSIAVNSRQKMMQLPDVPDLAIAEFGALGFGELRDVFIFVVYRPFGGGVEAADEVKERALPRPAFADDGDLFAGFDVEREVAEDYEVFVAGAVDLWRGFRCGRVARGASDSLASLGRMKKRSHFGAGRVVCGARFGL